MPDKVAVIASVLKPVDDTRMYEKLGRSIRETNKYRVNIIGFDTKKPIDDGSVSFSPLYQGQRTGWGRLTAGWRFYRKLGQLKPDLVIVCAPELLPAAAWYKVCNGGRLWYDVQENYQKNIRYQSAYPSLLKPFLAVMMALIEHGTRPLVDHYLLAENGYLKELSFVKGKSTVLENKFVPLSIISGSNSLVADPKTKQLIFTGTCSRENGILEAISLVSALRKQGKPVRLQIVGQVQDEGILEFIRSQQEQQQPASTPKVFGAMAGGQQQEPQMNQAEELPWIELIGNGGLVPHPTIMQYAAQADFGLVAHRPNPSNESCIPTKIYEYLGLRIPMILQDHPLWESVVDPYQAAVAIDYQNFDPDALWEQMMKSRFFSKEPGPEITWEQEATKLLNKLEMMNDE